MSFEQISQDSSRDSNQSEILKQNVNTLIELFELNDREGKFASHQRIADRITSIIQRHTDRPSNNYPQLLCIFIEIFNGVLAPASHQPVY